MTDRPPSQHEPTTYEKIVTCFRVEGFEATMQRFPEEMQRLEGLLQLLDTLEETP